MSNTISTNHSLTARGQAVWRPGTCAPTTYPFSQTVAWTDVRVGTKLQGWRQIIKAHNSASTLSWGKRIEVDQKSACNVIVTKSSGNSGSCYPTGAVYTREYSGNLLGNYIPAYPTTPVDPTGVTSNQASANFYSAVHETYSKFCGGVFIGELHETLHMIKHPCDALFRNINSGYLRRVRSNRSTIRRFIRTGKHEKVRKILSDLWLEGYLGWYPLMGDIESAVSAYNAYVERPEYEHVIGVGHNSSTTASSSAGATFSGLSWVRDTVDERTYHVRFFGEVTGALTQAVHLGSEEGHLVGFDWAEFVPTVYELIPASFIADYFSNLGSVLSAPFVKTSNIVWVNQTYRCENKRTVTGRNLSVALVGGEARGTMGENTCAATYFTRQAGIPPLPAFQVRVPPLLRQWSTLAALFGTHGKTVRDLNRR